LGLLGTVADGFCPPKTTRTFFSLGPHLSNSTCDNPGVKNESAPRNLEVKAGGSGPATQVTVKLQETTRPPTIQFQEIPIGQFFEFRGRRYRKLALSMASDEDRNGNIFQA
jgi:hypothetical protein